MEKAHFNMVEQQIRPWHVANEDVLEQLKLVRRELFVPAEQRAMAFMEVEVPLGYGVKMWQPKFEGRALEILQLKPTDHVLEVGTGSGYLTALLARLTAKVTSVEIVAELSAGAARNLAGMHLKNVQLEVGDASNGWGEGRYDAIVLTGSVPLSPTALMNQLSVGGRLFAVIGDAPTMKACVITRTAEDAFDRVALFETSLAPLQNAPQPQRFVF